MNTLEELREQTEKAERRLKLMELQIAHYRNIMHQEIDMTGMIGNRILDISNSLEASNNKQHRIQEKILSCVDNKDDNGVLAGNKELANLIYNCRELVDQRTAMDEMKEAANQEARNLRRQPIKVEATYCGLRFDLDVLLEQYTQMGGTFDQS